MPPTKKLSLKTSWCFIFNSCTKENLQEIPAYITISEFSLTTNTLNEGANTENIDTFSIDNCFNAEEVVKKGIDFSKSKKFDVIIIDTAGRLHVDQELIEEVKKISAISNPKETFYVVDSMTGQAAVNSATEFNSYLDIPGIILTKLD